MSHIYTTVVFFFPRTHKIIIDNNNGSTLFFSFFSTIRAPGLYGCDKCKKTFQFFFSLIFHDDHHRGLGNNNYYNGCRYQICYGFGEKKNSFTRRRNIDDIEETVEILNTRVSKIPLP